MMATKPRIALVIGSARPTRFADKPAQWMLKQAQARGDMDVEVVDPAPLSSALKPLSCRACSREPARRH
jgi:NAD(P)H-dependent FMN reductase